MISKEKQGTARTKQDKLKKKDKPRTARESKENHGQAKNIMGKLGQSKKSNDEPGQAMKYKEQYGKQWKQWKAMKYNEKQLTAKKR